MKSQMSSDRKATYFIILAILVWASLIFVGARVLLTYEFTPGTEDQPLHTWPATAKLSQPDSPYTLLVVIHPLCSCSRASIGELSKIMARFPDTLRAEVLFVTPKHAGSEWSENEHWLAATAIPGVHAIHDIDGKTASAFHVQTSGYTLLYDRSGKLLFSGGITSARGHSGDNAGSQAIIDIVSGGTPSTQTTHAFGCHVFKKS